MTPPSPLWGSTLMYTHELPRRTAAVTTTYEGFELFGRLLSVFAGVMSLRSVRRPSKHNALKKALWWQCLSENVGSLLIGVNVSDLDRWVVDAFS